MKTVEEIYREMVELFAQETGVELAGTGETAVRLYALAAQVYGLYEEAAWTKRQCFPQTATGEELEKHAALRGLHRTPAARAQGTLRFSVREALEQEVAIPKGTVCMTVGQAAFATTQAAELAAGAQSVDVPAQAVEAGPGGNAAPGAVRTMAVAPVGIAACTNPAAFSGGREEESDEALRARVLASYRGLPNGTNAAYYAQAAMEVEGVAAVSVLPKNRGLGTVDVVIAAAGGLPGSALVQEVQTVLAARREVAVSVEVKAPVTVPVNVVVAVKPEAGLLGTTVVERVRQAVSAWFDGTRLGQNLLVAQMRQLIFQVDGVANYTLGAPANDVTMRKDELPVLQSLTVEVMA